MNKIVSIVLLVVGIMLTIWGINASNSFSSGVSQVFTGSPTDKSMWLLVAGIVVAITGAFGLLRGTKV